MKRAYTPQDRTWKPRLTGLRRMIAAATEAVMEAQAAIKYRQEDDTRRLAHLADAQRELAKWEHRLGLVRNAEQLRLLPV